MSHEEHKEKRSKRIGQKIRHMIRQFKIHRALANDDRYEDLKEAHRYHKISGATCGNSNCMMCGNPRKFFKQRTIQEERFIQTEKWVTE